MPNAKFAVLRVEWPLSQAPPCGMSRTKALQKSNTARFLAFVGHSKLDLIEEAAR